MLPSSVLVNALRANIRNVCIRNMRKNPGIDRRVKMLSSPTDRINDAEAENLDLEELEADFMNVHKTHKEHVRQFADMKEQEKFYIVKQKYFKESYPNFLTWHDKEQIRYLHRKDPEEWSVEKLAEGFPALPDVIAKIVKSTWRKRNQSKISNHDQHVEENWNMFKEGKMHNLPRELKEHLKKFTNRGLVFTPYKIPEEDNESTITIKPKLSCTEFSNIISDYEKLRLKSQTCVSEDTSTSNFKARHDSSEKKKHKNVKQHENRLPKNNESDTYYEKPPNNKSSTNLTLDSFKMKVERKVKAGNSVSADDQLIISQLNHVKEETQPESKAVELKPEDFQKVPASKFNKPENNYLQVKRTDYNHLMYPEKITIPAKLRKRGYTYKLNDCYYDYDGKFLYRVPGMVQ